MSFVTCKLFAQRGNQQFMIAATAAHAWKHGVDFKIPREGHSPELPTMPWPWLPEWNTSDGLGAPYVEPQEQFGQYHEMPYWPKMRLHGYFQNQDYFNQYRQQIIDLFFKKIDPISDTVGIHIRRGDYLLHPTKYIVSGHEYLSSAIKHFTDQGYEAFSIFSDDIPWCKAYFAENYYKELDFVFSEGATAETDQHLLAACEHQIISASTFSWWSAYANPNGYKQVICPATWFGEGNSHLKSSQICPPEWIRK